jgi:hypothetical protein
MVEGVNSNMIYCKNICKCHKYLYPAQQQLKKKKKKPVLESLLGNYHFSNDAEFGSPEASLPQSSVTQILETMINTEKSSFR